MCSSDLLDAAIVATGASLAVGLGVASIYLAFPGRSLAIAELLAAFVFLGGLAAYLIHRPAARQLVWPAA